MGLLAGILGLSFVIFFHELGHFLVARMFGVKVYTFSIGFGRKIYSRHIGGTEYAISIIPLGGYVKMKGESIGSNSNYSSNRELVTSESGLGWQGRLGGMIEWLRTALRLQKPGSVAREGVSPSIAESSSRDPALAPARSKPGDGDHSSHQYDSDSVNSKHPIVMILISLAGPGFNFLLALIVYIAIFNHGFMVHSNSLQIGHVDPSAKAAGILMEGDTIQSINGKALQTFGELAAAVRQLPPSQMSVSMSVLRDGRTLELDVPLTLMKPQRSMLGGAWPKGGESGRSSIPDRAQKGAGTGPGLTDSGSIASAADGPASDARGPSLLEGDSAPIQGSERGGAPESVQRGQMRIGISPMLESVQYPFTQAIIPSLQRVCDDMLMIYDGIKKIVMGVIGLDNVSSVIGMVDLSNKAYNHSLLTFFFVMSVMSINLGVVNLIPLPMLDGGQVVFSMYRLVFGSDVSVVVAKLLMFVGVAFVVGLMSVGMFNDIRRLML